MEIDDETPMTLEDDKILLVGNHNANANVSAGMEMVRGFPSCPLPDITIIGDVRDAILQTDASLLVDGQHIPSEEFCIERVRTADQQLLPAKIFACSEHAPKG